MDNEFRDRHLNLFHFYGQSGKQYLEDNLTRGLAICLENDSILLDRFLREILNEDYNQLFKTEGESSELIINVQQKARRFEGIQTVFGVPLTTQELSLEPDSDSAGADDPITDLSIQIGDQLILIEVKRTAQDCRNQLQNQIDQLIDSIDADVEQKIINEFSWNKLMEMIWHTLKYEREVSSKNLFTSDYYQFIKTQFPSWFPHIPFCEIHFPEDLKSKPKLKELLDVRLNLIKQKMLEIRNEEKGSEDELVHDRANIPVPDYPWVDEINIEPISDKETNKKFIAIQIWPGDTKTQGYSIFKKDAHFKWPEYINDKTYRLLVHPYVKFSHMKGLCWVRMYQNQNPKTHTKQFFNRYAGKWKRTEEGGWKKGSEGKWREFDQIIEEVNELGGNWKVSSGFREKISNSQRTYFYVSPGFAIEVRIPYHIAQEIDRGQASGVSDLANVLHEVSKSLLQEMNQLFSK